MLKESLLFIYNSVLSYFFIENCKKCAKSIKDIVPLVKKYNEFKRQNKLSKKYPREEITILLTGLVSDNIKSDRKISDLTVEEFSIVMHRTIGFWKSLKYMNKDIKEEDFVNLFFHSLGRPLK